MNNGPSDGDSTAAPPPARRAAPLSGDEWIDRYSESHQNRVNRAFHLIGIPVITLSVILAGALFFRRDFWPVPTALFVAGWALQFIGHAFEGKPPEFLHDWRFLFVGLRWWAMKFRGPR